MAAAAAAPLALGSSVSSVLALTGGSGAAAAVVAKPDPKWGEIGVAVIVRRADGPAVSEVELLGYLEGRCAKYRWPRQFVFWDVMPKSGYGKIVKKDIKSLLVERGEFTLPEQAS